MDVAEPIAQERRAFAETLRSVGPDAPTLAEGWSAHDVAAHVLSLDRFRGIPTALGREVVVRSGLRLNDVAGRFADRALRSTRRRGFAWACDRLLAPPPPPLLRPSIAPVGLVEVFVHHEDVRRANDRSPRAAPHELASAIPWLLRYQRSLLPAAVSIEVGDLEARPAPAVRIRGDLGDVVLWLAGRRAGVQVALEGDEADVRAVEAAPLRI